MENDRRLFKGDKYERNSKKVLGGTIRKNGQLPKEKKIYFSEKDREIDNSGSTRMLGIQSVHVGRMV